VLSELKETYLESVMIALPKYGAQLTLNDFMPLWRVVEDFMDQKKILSAAVCDFMLPLLSDVSNAAKVMNLLQARALLKHEENILVLKFASL
jgi:hypothetical protein